MSELAHVLRPLLPVDDPNALVDASTRDDAAVYLLEGDRASGGRALVVTVDFFTPVVDEPRDFGRIGAANALSDVYAMGGRPLFALNLVGFPRNLLSSGALEEILAGGSEVAREAGVPILGGHSIDDPEPKYGLVVVGEVDPARMTTNAAARPGDVLVLTKPLGTGILSTAIKAGAASPEEIRAATRSMTRLNAPAASVMVDWGIRCATDVTGYGLLGHLDNILRESGVGAEIRASEVPVLPGALRLAGGGQVPGGTKRNREDCRTRVEFQPGGEGGPEISEGLRWILVDAQTSGGLLMAVPPGEGRSAEDRARALVTTLKETDPEAAVIGTVTPGPAGRVVISA